MRSEQVADLVALARGLALSARRRGVSAAEAPGVMARSLPRLLVDQPELLQACLVLLRHPACSRLLAAASPPARAEARHQMLDRGGVNTSAAIVPLEAAFVDGLLEGWQQAPGAAQEPDLRTWLLGAGVGAVIGAGLSWLGLSALRVVAPSPQAAQPPAPVAKGTSDSAELAAGPVSTAQPGLQGCAALASPGREQLQLAAASNFGNRLARDASGAAIPASPALIVLHETVLDLPATIALFQRSQSSDAAQSSYHVLIGRDGQRVRIVPDRARAFGAGDSAFGDLRFKTSAANPPSINNIALHVSLESPADGRGDAEAHSGYTAAQYRALAEQVLRWQALYGIPMERVTTHAAVDRSHSRYDPRSFRWDLFDQAYADARRSCA